MYIEKIHINSFGKLRELDVDLSNGVNIIEGSNEAGKSTVAAFIKFAFYGLSNKTNGGALSERERYVSWDTGFAGGYLVLVNGEERYRIERLLSIVGHTGESDDKKPTYRENVGITDLSNNSPVKTKSSPGEYFFGVDEELFSKTAYVGQLEGVKVSGEKMTQAIENMLFTADENVNIQKALKKLDAARVAYLHKNQKGGKIYERKQEYDRLEARLEEVKQINADILAKESSLEDSRTRYEEIKASFASLSASVKSFDNKNILSLFDTLREFEKKCGEAAQREAEFAEKYTKNGFLPDRDYFNEIDRARDAVKSAQERVNGVTARLAEAKLKKAEAVRELEESKGGIDKYNADIEKCAHGLNVIRTLKIWMISFAVMAVIMLGAGVGLVMLTSFGDIGKVVSVCAAAPIAGAIVSAVISSSRKSVLRGIYKKYGALNFDDLSEKIEKLKREGDTVAIADNKISELESELGKEEITLSQAQSKLDEMLERCGVTDLELLEAELDKCESARIEREKNAEKAELLKKQLYQYDEAQIRSESIAADDGITPENIAEKRRELEFLANQSHAMEKRIHDLEKELAGLKPQSESSAKIAESLELNREAIREYSLKHAAYLLAYEKISEASESMRADISPRLAKDTCATMGDITGGKYTELGVDAELNLSVTVDGVTRRLDTLSAGTQDAAYVSLRLALMSSLFGESKPAVVFDESFSRLDEARLGGVLLMTQALAENGVQSIVLTSGKREAELMSKHGEFKRILL